MIHYVVEEAVAAGVEEVILVSHPSKVGLINYFQEDPELNAFLKKKGKKAEIKELTRLESLVRLTVVHQQEPLGLGHAVLCARHAVGEEPFLVMLPDVLIAPESLSSKRLVESCQEGEWGVFLENVSRQQASSYGMVSVEGLSQGMCWITGAIEKPSPQEAPSDLALLGRYLFFPTIFDEIESLVPGALGEIQLTDAIHILAQKNKGRGVLCQGEIFDVGTPEGLGKAMSFLQKI